jgi:hypothetical protein
MRIRNYCFTVTAFTMIAFLLSCDNKLDVPEPTQDVFVLETPNTINGHEYVDLGLSVKWGTCNIDALTPVEYGGYYAWGDDAPYAHIAEIFTKNGVFRKDIHPISESGFTEDLARYHRVMFALENRLEHKNADIAHYKWGEGWRLPTYAEFKELYNNCTWQELIIDGIVCYKGTSKIPGYTDRYIILPNAGCQWVEEETDFDAGFDVPTATYWSSTFRKAAVFNAKQLDDSIMFFAPVGFPVRPVCK